MLAAFLCFITVINSLLVLKHCLVTHEQKNVPITISNMSMLINNLFLECSSNFYVLITPSYGENGAKSSTNFC